MGSFDRGQSIALRQADPGAERGCCPGRSQPVGSAQTGEQAGSQDMEREPGPLG